MFHRVSIPVKRYFLPVLSAGVFSLTLPFVDAGFLAFIVLIPLLFFATDEKNTSKQVFFGGALAGFLFAFAVLAPLSSLNAWWWVAPNSFLWEQRETLLFMFIIVAALYVGALFIGFATLLFKKLHTNTLLDVLVFPVVWVGIELLREPLVLGFTWGELGYGLHDYIYVLQLASLFGVYGVSFFIVAVNVLIFLIIKKTIPLIQERNSFRHIAINTVTRPSVFVLLLIVLSVTVYGYTVVNAPTLSAEKLDVAIIHSRLSTLESATVQGLNEHMRLLLEASAENPDIVIAPENAFPPVVIEETTKKPLAQSGKDIGAVYFTKITELSRSYPTTSYLIGLHTEQNGRRFNSLVVMENGVITDIYQKQRLLPVVEDNAGNFFSRRVEPFEKGAGERFITVKGKRATPLICSEIIFPQLAKGSGLIINISNDSVFDSPLVGKQNHIISSFRAVENRAYVLRSVKGGISSIIDPQGRTIVQTNSTDSTILTGTISY